MSDGSLYPGEELIPLPDLNPFMGCDYVHDRHGFIVWRVGTGLNVELLHVKAAVTGGGEHLLRSMLNNLKKHPPYCTVFGFTRTCNVKAQRFYERCGFDLTLVNGVYADGAAYLFSATFEELCKIHLGEGK
jgi:hypothetical protein